MTGLSPCGKSKSKGKAPSRKRSHASTGSENTSGDANGKKPRGRPRVENTDDVTALDRRRTQVRNAQRDYRHRKETKLSTLEKQSSQLHSTVEEMHKTFLHFQKSVLKLGLLQSNPELSQELKTAVETFTILAKTANKAVLRENEGEGEENQSEHNALPERPVEPSKRSQDPPLQTATPPEVEHVDLGWGYATTAEVTYNPQFQDQSQSQPQGQPQGQSQGQSLHSGNYLSHISSASYHLQHPSNESIVSRQHQASIQGSVGRVHSPHTPYHHKHPPLPFGLIGPGREHPPEYSFTYTASIPNPEISSPGTAISTPTSYIQPDLMVNRGLPSIRTYSYEETSFARRLMRVSLESGYQILSQPHSGPLSVDSIFRLSLPFISFENLLKKFKWMVSRDINEDFDWWDTPFIHIGGAGTHYPRRDVYGNIVPIKNSWTVRQTGPFERHMMKLESVADGRWEDVEGVDLRGYEGEWFDAYDVQGYIEEQWACKIDPRSSFAQCLVAEEDLATHGMSGHESDHSSLGHGSTSTSPPVQGSNAFDVFAPPYGPDTTSFNHLTPLSNPQATDLSRSDIVNISFDQTLGLDLAPGSRLGFAGNADFNVGTTFGLGTRGEVEGIAVVGQKRDRVAWMDVTKFIHGLIGGAKCLGRAPGYQRDKVDAALREALVPPY